jgi:hypothetical protein
MSWLSDRLYRQYLAEFQAEQKAREARLKRQPGFNALALIGPAPMSREQYGDMVGDFLLPRALADVKRSSQLSAFAIKGNTSRRKYDEDMRCLWRELATTDERIRKIPSKRRQAQLIAERLGWPKGAVESIRKELSRKR